MRTQMITASIAIALGMGMAGCVGEIEGDEYGSNMDGPTFEEYEESVYQEPWEGGVYIVNGDTPIENLKKLREYYDLLYGGDGALIVHLNGNSDAKWSNSQKLNLTYCVSTTFNNRYNAAVTGMAEAAAQWEAAANVNFIHVSSQDTNCTSSNNNVLFDVRPVSNVQYLARAFFPGQSRGTRNVLIDSSAFNTSWALDDILAHELGHALGFRHEHTRPEAGTCFEDNSWRPLTPYDSASIMHYPQCNGSSNSLTMTNTDRQGAAALYGAPQGTPDPDPDPTPDPDPDPTPDPDPPTGTPRTGSASGTLARNQQIAYQPLSVLSGTTVEVEITGTGDADLYVQFGSQPSRWSYDCRPYLNGSYEQCSLDVPNGEDEVYIMVRGYTAATYNLTASWIEP